ncbi:fimbrial protein [Franconibacter pulveris]|uniref:fimbrial protein n=1 Tax=Franconibacter pulveris TaxID=435910 RepID=UPI000497443D|nr:fimbrial protein [Franconibacter pulveris]
MKSLKSIIFILLTLSSINVFAGCVNNIAAYTKNINFGNVTVQRDVPAGTVVATQSVLGDINFTCTGPAMNTYHEVMYTGLTSFGNNVYQIGVSGYGIRVSENGPGGDFHHYFPIEINGWNDNTGTYSTNLYKFELVKTSEPAQSGAIRTGVIADTSMFNQFYIGTFNITGGTITTLACSLSTPNMSFPIGNIPASSFGSAPGTTPAGAQNTQYLGLNCNPGANINVSLSGKQNPDVSTPGVLALSGQGNAGVAKGVGVQLLYKGTPLALNNRIVLKKSSGGEEIFPLVARYYQTRTSVTTGSANASATLTITYQ